MASRPSASAVGALGVDIAQQCGFDPSENGGCVDIRRMDGIIRPASSRRGRGASPDAHRRSIKIRTLHRDGHATDLRHRRQL